MRNKRIVIKTAKRRADIRGELFDAELSPKETYTKIVSLIYTHTLIIKIRTIQPQALKIINYLIATKQINANLVKVEVLEKGRVAKTYSDWDIDQDSVCLRDFPVNFYSFLDLPDNL